MSATLVQGLRHPLRPGSRVSSRARPRDHFAHRALGCGLRGAILHAAPSPQLRQGAATCSQGPGPDGEHGGKPGTTEQSEQEKGEHAPSQRFKNGHHLSRVGTPTDSDPDAAARLVQRRRRETAVRRQARNLADELGNEDYHETFVRDETRALLITYRCESAPDGPVRRHPILPSKACPLSSPSSPIRMSPAMHPASFGSMAKTRSVPGNSWTIRKRLEQIGT